MGLLIRRTVSFDFLGDHYKDAYVAFRSIPVRDYQGILSSLPKDNQDDGGKSITLILETLKKYFVDGKFPDESGTMQELKAEDLDDLDQDSTVRCFEGLVGKALDPKDEMPSTTPSTTVA